MQIGNSSLYSAIDGDQLGNSRNSLTLAGAWDGAGFSEEDGIFDSCSFRSVTGIHNWDDSGAFMLSMDGEEWVSSVGWRVTAPTANAQNITVVSGSTMHIDSKLSGLQLDQLVNNGTIIITDSSVTIANGEGTDFVNNGTLRLSGTQPLVVSAGAEWVNRAAADGGSEVV